jgi:hypothetical protein
LKNRKRVGSRKPNKKSLEQLKKGKKKKKNELRSNDATSPGARA